MDFVYDNWELVNIPEEITDGIDNPLIVFINNNNQETVANLSTAQPSTNIETLYYGSPTNSANRFPILELVTSTGNQVYVSKHGNTVAYFQYNSTDTTTGLYVLDVELGLSARVLPISSLVQRGFFSAPEWSPDGERLAIMLATGYDMDVFTVGKDGSDWQNLTNHGSYDLWPSWSPDGRYIVFVSDRAVCPSWIPGEPGTCDATTTPPPNGGNVYLLEINTGNVTQLSDQWVTEPPRWVNERLISFAATNPDNLLNPERRLWIADIITGTAHEVSLIDEAETPIYLSETWSSDGSMVLFQRAGETNKIVLMNADGNRIDSITNLTFPRYGMVAAWSPDGTRIAIGGVNGQCPYGALVVDDVLDIWANGSNPPPSMCNPVYSPDGQYLAFMGINPETADGSSNIYISNPSGYGTTNLTGDLRGEITLLGWVGGQ